MSARAMAPASDFKHVCVKHPHPASAHALATLSHFVGEGRDAPELSSPTPVKREREGPSARALGG